MDAVKTTRSGKWGLRKERGGKNPILQMFWCNMKITHSQNLQRPSIDSTGGQTVAVVIVPTKNKINNSVKQTHFMTIQRCAPLWLTDDLCVCIFKFWAHLHTPCPCPTDSGDVWLVDFCCCCCFLSKTNVSVVFILLALALAQSAHTVIDNKPVGYLLKTFHRGLMKEHNRVCLGNTTSNFSPPQQ